MTWVEQYQQYVDDIKNGVIKAIEWVAPIDYDEEIYQEYLNLYDKRECVNSIGKAVLINNTYNLCFKVKQSIVKVEDDGYWVKYYSKDRRCFLTDKNYFSDLKRFTGDEHEFYYDGEYYVTKDYYNKGTVNEQIDIWKHKVYKELNYYVRPVTL